MIEQAIEEPSDHLLQLADEHGFSITPTQLARWHRAGLLPAPIQHHPEGIRGSQTIYPVGTGQQLLALCEARFSQGERRLLYLAWHLWWLGYPILMDQVRKFMGLSVKRAERIFAQLADPATGELSELAWNALDKAEDARLDNHPLRRIRKRTGRQNFVTFLRVLLEISIGQFDGFQSRYDATDRLIVEKGFDIRRAYKDHLPGAEPWLTPDGFIQSLQSFSQRLAGFDYNQLLENAEDNDLLRARDIGFSICAVMQAVGQNLEQQRGRGAFGMTEFAKVLPSLGPEGQAWFIVFFLGWLPIATEIERANMEFFASLLRAHSA